MTLMMVMAMRRLMKQRSLLSLSLLILLLAGNVVVAEDQTAAPLQCSLSDADESAIDPALKEMTYDLGDGEGQRTTTVYVEPPIFAMYKGFQSPASTKVQPKFNGLAGKFINMSNQPVTLYWCVRACVLRYLCVCTCVPHCALRGPKLGGRTKQKGNFQNSLHALYLHCFMFPYSSISHVLLLILSGRNALEAKSTQCATTIPFLRQVRPKSFHTMHLF